MVFAASCRQFTIRNAKGNAEPYQANQVLEAIEKLKAQKKTKNSWQPWLNSPLCHGWIQTGSRPSVACLIL